MRLLPNIIVYCILLITLFYFKKYEVSYRAPASNLEIDCRFLVENIINAEVKPIARAYFSTSDKEHAALMLDLIKKEQKSISLAYYQTDGNKVGNVLFAALADAANRGVKVKVLLDAWNPDDWIDTPIKVETLKALADLGVEIKYFNNVERGSNWEKTLSFLNPKNFNRMHDKIAIFEQQNFIITGDRMPQNSNFRIQVRKGAADRDEDGKITYKFNYLSAMAAVNSKEVREMTQKYYADLWKMGSFKNIDNVDEHKLAIRKKNLPKFLNIAESSDFNKSLDDVYKKMKPIDSAQYVSDAINKIDDPYVLGVSKNIIEMISQSKEDIVIFSPYMSYTPEYLKEINAALDRGVKVTFIVPSWESIDTPLTLQLWEAQAAELKARGVNIVQHKGRDFMHIKMAVVDKKKTFIGSYNFNPRSTFTDHESGVIISDMEFANSVHTFKQFIEENESTAFTPSQQNIFDKIKIFIVKKLMSWSFFIYRQL